MLNKLRARILSLQFRAIRRTVIILIAKIPKDLERAIVFGDALNHLLMISPFKQLFKFSIPKNIQVKINDLTFDSPIISASFKDDVRIQEVSYDGDYGILNSLGLPTKGVSKFLPKIDNKKLTKFNRPIGISIGGNSYEEYYSVFSEIESHLNSLNFSQFFYEVNISCPNTDDGKCLSDDLETLKKLILNFRDTSSRVIVVKVSPDSPDEEVLRICEILSNIIEFYLHDRNSNKISIN